METLPRRLAALLSADAVGYTLRMARDEQATVRAIGACRELIAARVAAHGGRVVDAPGDNLLAEFPSALEAVRCALAVQEKLRERDDASPEAARLAFRIGVHLGDVMVEDERIYGDGVNVAARLEALAPPGGVCVSGAVHEQVRGKLDLAFDDLGEQELRNVPHPVRALRARLAAPAPADARAPGTDHPTIAVLPFDNLSADPDHAFLADGLAADLITLLSGWRLFPVIARASSFTLKGRALDPRQASRELGARYLVSGSVRAAGSRLRVSAELVDAASGHQVWGDKYDRPLADVFELQDELARSIVAALQPALRGAEAERARRAPPESLEAWSLANRAWIELQSDLASRETCERSLAAAERAIEKDPGYGLAHALRAFALSLLHQQLLPGPPGGAIAEIERSIAQALRLAPDDPQVLQIRGAVMGNLGRTQDAIRAHQRALELDPSNAQALAALGIARIFARRAEDALAEIDRAAQLSPRDPLLYNWLGFRSLACLVLGRPDEAAEDARRSLERRETRTAWMVRAIALSELGQPEEARRAQLEFARMAPELTLARLEPLVRGLAPTPEHAERFLRALERAGF